MLSPPPVESMEEVKDEPKEPSVVLVGCTETDVADASPPSTSFFAEVR